MDPQVITRAHPRPFPPKSAPELSESRSAKFGAMAEILPAQASPSPANPNPFPYPASPSLGQSLGRNFSSSLHHAPSPAPSTAAGALSPAAAEVEKFALSLRSPLFPAVSPQTQFVGGSSGQARHSEVRDADSLSVLSTRIRRKMMVWMGFCGCLICTRFFALFIFDRFEFDVKRDILV